MADYSIYVEGTPGSVEAKLGQMADALNTLAGKSTDIYGFDLDLGNPDPDGSVTYVAANAGFTPAHMDYAADAFDYGDWEGAFFLPKPCMLSFAGVVEHYLDPNDYGKFTDGSASDVATSTTANAMMRWPVIWVSRWQTGDTYHFRCSPYEFSGAQCWANLNADGDVVPFYTPIYVGSLDSEGRLRSLSGGTNYVSANTDAERAAAAKNGDGWEIERMVDRMLLCDLTILMSKSRDSQTAFGRGVNGVSAAIGQGTMDAKGLFYGKSDNASGVKAFGMENPWGNLWRRLVGWVKVGATQKVKLTTGTEDGSTVTAYNTTGDGYIALGGCTPTGTSGGYVSKSVVTPYGLIPVGASGSASTYACDGLWFNNSVNTLAFVGGGWGNGARVGCSYANLVNAASVAGADVGAAPSFK